MTQIAPKPTTKDLPWKLIVTLAAIGLLWPLSKALGFTDNLAPAVIGGVWVGIRVLWVVIVLAVRDARPLQTLLAASVLYELIAIIPQQILWDQEPMGRVPAAIATLVMGVVTGGILGLIATGFQRLKKT